MEYFLKSSVIVAIFYLMYRICLHRETFFYGNRLFLLLGLIVSALVPLIVIPRYVEITPVVTQTYAFPTDIVLNTPSDEQPFNFGFLALIAYALGFLYYFSKLVVDFISLKTILKGRKKVSDGKFTFIETDLSLAPFSFFNRIVYNPNQFDAKELQLILNHEKIHASQHHSLDVILSQLFCTIFWFNPVIWLYKKAIVQNLEFIADFETETKTSCKKTYQSLLLKTSLPNHQLVLANNFYNSLIKKRIIMLHTSKSHRINAWKYSLVIPILVAFVLNFNTVTIAQTKTTEPAKVKIGQNVLRFVISKDTKDSQLESIKSKLAEHKAKITFEDITRNDRKEITGIKIDYEHAGKNGNFFVNSDNPITDIAISLNMNENELTVSQSTKNLSQSFEIITEDGDKKVKTSGTKTNVLVVSTDGDDEEVETITVVGKDGEEHEVKRQQKVYVIKTETSKVSDDSEDVMIVKANKKDTIWIKKDVKNVIWTNEDGSDVKIMAVEKGNNNVRIFTDENEKPLILLDGKEITKEEMEALDSEKIESMSVYTGQAAIKMNGEKAKDGVIIIETKKD